MPINVTEDTVGLILAALTLRAQVEEQHRDKLERKIQEEHEHVVRCNNEIDALIAELTALRKKAKGTEAMEAEHG